jgi:phage terminase large subunit
LPNKAQLPEWARDFLQPARYKIAWGGRGSSKSWTFARMLLLKAAARPLRILCARELQNSIQDSVHQLLSDQVKDMGLSHAFIVQEQKIRSKVGSEFLFKGLRGLSGDAAGLKSLEGVDVCWIEEGQMVGFKSWQTLTPTMRKAGAEIWATMNPNLADDPLYKLVSNPPPNAIIRRVNYRENPWFGETSLREEMEWMRKTDPDAYAHVWLGECRTHSDAQILHGKTSIEWFEPGDLWDGPYFGADWGFSQDPTALVKCWIFERRLYVEHEAWGVGVELDHTPALFDKVPGVREHLILADSARPETISYIKRQGFKIRAAEKGHGSVEEGIAFLRSFENIVIHPRCVHMAEEARLYSYKVDRQSGEVTNKIDDRNNHTIDACIAEGSLVTTKRGNIPIESVIVGDMVLTRDGWNKVLKSCQTSPSRGLWEIKAGDKSLKATGDHEVFVVGKGFVRMDAIRYNDWILTYTGDELCKLKQLNTKDLFTDAIQNIMNVLQGFILGDQKQKGILYSFTVRFTRTILEKFQRAIMSTTRTETLQTTTQSTLSASQQSNIFTNIGMMNAHKNRGNTAKGLDRLQRNGIQARKVWSFIGKLGRLVDNHLSQSHGNAINAEMYSLQGNQGIQIDFAAIPVNLLGEEHQVSMMKTDHALFAGSTLSSTNTQGPKLVPVRVESVCAITEKSPVYDLAIEGVHEFVAGGILVHNCRYALSPIMKRGGTARQSITPLPSQQIAW